MNKTLPKGTFFSKEECKLILAVLEKEWLPREYYLEYKLILAKLREGCEE